MRWLGTNPGCAEGMGALCCTSTEEQVGVSTEKRFSQRGVAEWGPASSSPLAERDLRSLSSLRSRHYACAEEPASGS